MGDYEETTLTFRLFARPLFREGMARLADPVGALNQYNRDGAPGAADAHALYADWAMGGNDLILASENGNGASTEIIPCGQEINIR